MTVSNFAFNFNLRPSKADLPWAKKSAQNNPMETKYAYVCHAEMNAIMNKNAQSLKVRWCKLKR
jgi:deoxycytidylate deaminase